MATKAQINANRLNAQKSTGPKTPAGKAAVSRNRITHGLLAKDAVIPGEDEKQYCEFSEAIFARYQPIDPLEEILVHQIVTTSWRLRRVPLIESQILRQRLERLAEHDEDVAADPAASWGEAYTWEKHDLGPLGRYEAQLRRNLSRSIKDLEQLQKTRPPAPAPAPPPPIAESPQPEPRIEDHERRDCNSDILQSERCLYGEMLPSCDVVCASGASGVLARSHGIDHRSGGGFHG